MKIIIYILQICELSAQYNQLSLLKYFHENGYRLENICITCIKYDSVECLKYARENGCVYDNKFLWSAIKLGSIKCLKFLYIKKLNLNKKLILCSIKRRQIECLKFLHESGCEYDKNILKYTGEEYLSKSIFFGFDIDHTGEILKIEEISKYILKNMF